MRKILFVATVVEHIKSFHIPYINQLNEDGYLVDVASRGVINIDSVNKCFDLSFSRNPLDFGNIKAYYALKDIIKKGNYETIICHTPIASVLCRYAARKVNARMIYVAHGFHFYKGCPTINRLIFKNAEELAAKYTDVLFTMNEEDFLASKELKLRKGGKRIKTNGIGFKPKSKTERTRDEVCEELDIPKDAFVISCVAEFTRNKNQKVLVEAMEELAAKDVYVVLCGSGQTFEEVKSLVNEKGLDKKIIFTGFCKDVESILEASDLFVFTSFREGLPVAVMEAMNKRLAVIGSDVRGVHDLIEDKKGGLLFDVMDNNASYNLAQMIEELKNDVNRRKSYGIYNYEKIQAYKIDNVLPEYIYYYEGHDKDE